MRYVCALQLLLPGAMLTPRVLLPAPLVRYHKLDTSSDCQYADERTLRSICATCVKASTAHSILAKDGVTSFVHADFTPKGGFRSVYAELAACFLTRAEDVVNALGYMARCTRFWDARGGCDTKYGRHLLRHVRLCCAGNQFLVSGGAAQLCKVSTALHTAQQTICARFVLPKANMAIIVPLSLLAACRAGRGRQLESACSATVP